MGRTLPCKGLGWGGKVASPQSVAFHTQVKKINIIFLLRD